MLEMFNKVLGTGIALKMYFGEEEKARSRGGANVFQHSKTQRHSSVNPHWVLLSLSK